MQCQMLNIQELQTAMLPWTSFQEPCILMNYAIMPTLRCSIVIELSCLTTRGMAMVSLATPHFRKSLLPDLHEQHQQRLQNTPKPAGACEGALPKMKPPRTLARTTERGSLLEQ